MLFQPKPPTDLHGLSGSSGRFFCRMRLDLWESIPDEGLIFLGLGLYFFPHNFRIFRTFPHNFRIFYHHRRPHNSPPPWSRPLRVKPLFDLPTEGGGARGSRERGGGARGSREQGPAPNAPPPPPAPRYPPPLQCSVCDAFSFLRQQPSNDAVKKARKPV